MNDQIVSQATLHNILSAASAAATNREWPFGLLSDAEIAGLAGPSQDFCPAGYGPDGRWLDNRASTLSLIA